ncbi:MAG: hypothetical protein ACRC33_13875 [Gemmataceae bacterium]
MNQMELDESFAERLRFIHQAVALRDRSGKLLGVYTPHPSPEEAADYERALASVDRAELERRKREPGPRRTTAEVLERLSSLESQPCDTL